MLADILGPIVFRSLKSCEEIHGPWIISFQHQTGVCGIHFPAARRWIIPVAFHRHPDSRIEAVQGCRKAQEIVAYRGVLLGFRNPACMKGILEWPVLGLRATRSLGTEYW
jgi:hypothetical protein